MAWVICLTSASSRTMSGLISPRRMRAGTAAAASWAVWSSRQAAWTGASRTLIIWLVMVTGWPGAGLRRAARLASRWAWAAAARTSAWRTWAAAAFFAGLGTSRPGVVGRGGVGVQGVQGELGAGVADGALLSPPPRGQPPADFPGGQVGAGGQRVDLPGPAAAGGHPAGDLPQADRLPFARPVADGQRDRGVGQVVGVLPAPVIGAGDRGERVGGNVGGLALAPGQQVEPGPGDVGEQGRGPAAPVKAHRHAPPLADDLHTAAASRQSGVEGTDSSVGLKVMPITVSR